MALNTGQLAKMQSPSLLYVTTDVIPVGDKKPFFSSCITCRYTSTKRFKEVMAFFNFYGSTQNTSNLRI